MVNGLFVYSSCADSDVLPNDQLILRQRVALIDDFHLPDDVEWRDGG